MAAVGVVFGVLYALVTSFANVLSRRFCIVHAASSVQMLVVSHAAIGLMAAAGAALLWTPQVPPIGVWGGDIAMVVTTYMLGQVAMLTGLRKTDSSRVTPLLGLKVLFVALLMWMLRGEPFTGQQWVAVLLCVGATFMLNRAGGRLGPGTLAIMIFACFMYATCDTFINDINRTMREAGGFRLVLFGAAMAYCGTGVVSATLLPWFGSRELKQWRAATEYGVLWLIAAVFLYLSFDLAGVVLANIVIACRGLTAIMIGVLVAWAGHHHLEARAPRSVWVRRAVAALILVLAVALFKMPALW